jgi:hypothetical protein
VKLEWVVASSEDWITCTVEGELVGFARTFRLDPLRMVVFDVVVDERYAGWGLDLEIVRRLTAGSGEHERIEIFRRDDRGNAVVPGVGAAVEYRVPDAPPGAYLGQAGLLRPARAQERE